MLGRNSFCSAAGCVALAFLVVLVRPLNATAIPPAAITDTPDYAQLVERSSNRAFFTRFLGSSAASSARGDSSLTRLRSWPAFSQASFEWNVSLKSTSSLVTSKLFVAGGVVWALWLDLDGNSTRARAHGHDTVGVMLAASWASGWAEDEVVAVSVRVALPAADKNLPGRMQVPPDVAATLTRNASGMWAADLSRGLLERGLLGGSPDWMLLRLHLLNVTVRWREDGGHPEAAYSRAVREQVSAALGADGYGVREEFDAAVRTAVVVTESEDGTATGAASTYTWRGASYTANAVGELLWWLVHANLQCHGLDERDAYIKMEAVVAACDIRVGRLKSHPKVRVVASPTPGAVRYLDDQGDDLVRYSLPCRRPDTVGSSSTAGSSASSSSSRADGGLQQRRSDLERAGYDDALGGGEEGQDEEAEAEAGRGGGVASVGVNSHVSSGAAGTTGAANTAASDWAHWQQLWAEAAAASGRGKPGAVPGGGPAGGDVGDSTMLAALAVLAGLALLGVVSPRVLGAILALAAAGASPVEAAEVHRGGGAAAGAVAAAPGKRHGGHLAPHRADHGHGQGQGHAPHGGSGGGGRLHHHSSAGAEHSHAPPPAGGRGPPAAAGGDKHGRGAASSAGGSAGAGGGKGLGSPPPGVAAKRASGGPASGQLSKGVVKSAKGGAPDPALDGVAAAPAPQGDSAVAVAGPAAVVGQDGGDGPNGGGGGGWWARLWQPRGPSGAGSAGTTRSEPAVGSGSAGDGAGAAASHGHAEPGAEPTAEAPAGREGKKAAQQKGPEPTRRGTKCKAASGGGAAEPAAAAAPGPADAVAEGGAADQGPAGNAAEAVAAAAAAAVSAAQPIGASAAGRAGAAGPLRPHTPPPHDSQRQAAPTSADNVSPPAAPEPAPRAGSGAGGGDGTNGAAAASPLGAAEPQPQPQPFAGDAGAMVAALAAGVAAAAAASSASGAALTPRNSGPLTSNSSGSGYGSGPHAPLLSTGGASGSFAGAAAATGGGGSRGRVFAQPWSLAVLAEMAGEAAVGGGSGGGGVGGGGGLALQYACLMCRDGPREHGFLHGGSVHVGVCGECAGRLVMAAAAMGAAAGPGQSEGGGAGAVAGAGSAAGCGVPCPVCMQPADRLVEVIL